MLSGESTPRKRADASQEESPVYAFLERPSMIDYPGCLCGVFFTSGCNFSCGFCHNAALMGRKQCGLPWSRLDEICRKFKKEWVDAVCITGGEPTLAPDLIKLITFFRNFSFKIKLDSNGSRPDVLRECLPLVDYVAMDIKAGLSGYPELTGFTRTETIAESVKLILSSGTDHEFRTTVIEPFHTDAQMIEAGELIRGARRYCLQAFVPQDTLPDPRLRETRRTTPARLRQLEQLMKPYAEKIIIRGAQGSGTATRV
ncbi:MAG: anaerobic ribonucleoside-triphosphate reductase activating protein [Pontiellaceae bacterium]|jgi:pyruvate formate lyase activating enzyme|nr:anaerobic ribonucleoside-triphosphate reductase activating protein [Pontiellaceae bacterium]